MEERLEDQRRRLTRYGRAMMAVGVALIVLSVVLNGGIRRRVVGGGVDVQQGRQYDVAPDGRFLIDMELDSAAAPITLLMNWNPAAKE